MAEQGGVCVSLERYDALVAAEEQVKILHKLLVRDVAGAEREACARVVEGLSMFLVPELRAKVARAIRERGKK